MEYINLLKYVMVILHSTLYSSTKLTSAPQESLYKNVKIAIQNT